ncbi:MAG: SPOR domain-containing protein [Halobacteria archaeon]|nr:SPOR domain-containing protein [Halobacteria archaeon]
MRNSHRDARQDTGRIPGSSMRALMSGMLFAVALAGCSVLQPTNGTSPGSAARGTTDERLAALEAGLQQLAQRVDALQVNAAESRQGLHTAGARELPIEQQPVRPAIVLASNPPRRLPDPPAAPPPPVRAPVPRYDPPAAPVAPPPGEGDWVINLASYANESYASRKQAEFIDEGVYVEQVAATVKGKLIYRLRVAGFDSFRAASAEAGNIRTRLGLQDTWVARR